MSGQVADQVQCTIWWTPVSRALLLILEKIKNNAELEAKPRSVSNSKGAECKHKMESMDSCIPKKPKQVDFRISSAPYAQNMWAEQITQYSWLSQVSLWQYSYQTEWGHMKCMKEWIWQQALLKRERTRRNKFCSDLLQGSKKGHSASSLTSAKNVVRMTPKVTGILNMVHKGMGQIA